MSGTKEQPTWVGGGLVPASLADTRLDHFERMVKYITRAEAGGAFRGLDHEYCEKQLRNLAKTHDLVAAQRRRVVLLLDVLERHALVSMRSRTAV